MRSVRASAWASRDQAASDSGASCVACSHAETSAPTSPARFATSARSSSPCFAGHERPRALQRRARARAVEAAHPQPPQPLPRGGVGRRPLGLALRRVERLRDRAHVLVDPRRGAVGRRPAALLADPVAHGAGGGAVVPGLPVGGREQAQDGRVARLRVARVDEPLRRQREVAVGERVLGRGHEALHPVGAGSGVWKSTNWSEPAGTVRIPTLNDTRAHCWMSSSSPVK